MRFEKVAALLLTRCPIPQKEGECGPVKNRIHAEIEGCRLGLIWILHRLENIWISRQVQITSLGSYWGQRFEKGKKPSFTTSLRFR